MVAIFPSRLPTITFLPYFLAGLAILLFGYVPLNAQTSPIQFERIGPMQGLTRANVTDIYKDVHGYVWFGNFGNFRYDGQEVKSYPDGDAMAVRTGEMLADSWGKEPDSLYYYDPHRDTFINNYPSGVDPYGYWVASWRIGNCFRCFIKDETENLWYGRTGDGLFVYQPATKSYLNLRHRENISTSLSSDEVSSIIRDKEDRIWVGTWDAGLNLWVKDSTFMHFRYDAGNPNSLSSDSITLLMEDNGGIIWIGTLQGLNRLDTSTGKISRISFPEKMDRLVGQIFIDSRGWLWIATKRDGVITYDPEEERFNRFFLDEGGQPIMPHISSHTFTIVEDHQKRIWLGTEGSGVYIYDPGTGQLTNHQFDPRSPESLSDNTVRYMMKDNHDRIWIGTFNGVNVYDPNAKVFKHFESDKKGRVYFNSAAKYSGAEDLKGNIWIASGGGGLIRFDPRTENLSRVLKERVNVVEVDRKGNIWISQTSSLSVFEPSSNQVALKYRMHWTEAFYEDFEGRMWVGGAEGLLEFSSADSEPVLHRWDALEGYQKHWRILPIGMAKGCSGNLWMGSLSTGLLKINLEERTIKSFAPDIGNPQSIAGNLVMKPVFDKDCNLWLSLPGKGLSMLAFDQRYAPEPAFLNWNTKNSNLPDNGINRVVIDQQERIWVSSATAVSLFDRSENIFHPYTAKNGMKTLPNGMTLSRNGRIYVHGINGIGYFHPARLAVNQHKPPVYLTDIQINGQSLPLRGSSGDTLDFPSPLTKSVIDFTEEIQLTYRQNDIRLEFVALNYTAPELNQFRYRLIGHKDAWYSTDAGSLYANFTNLDPGTYTFHVQAANNDGKWNRAGATLKIIITPPWWATCWAYAGYGVLALALVTGIYRFQLRRRLALAEADRLRELDTFKTRFYTNITHEFRTPLTVILGLADQLGNQVSEHAKEKLKMIRRNGRQLLGLVNEMLDLSKLESGHLNLDLKQGDVIAYLKYIIESFHSLAEGKRIRLHFLSDLDEFYMDYDAERIAQVFSNLLSNAIKFTPEGKDVYVSVQSIEEASSQLQIEVKDTGKGIPKEEIVKIFDRFYQVPDSPAYSLGPQHGSGTGIGLPLAKELINLMGGEIQVRSYPGKGSVFTVVLPVTRSQKAAVPLPDNLPALQADTALSRVASSAEKPEAPQLLLVEDNPDLIKYLSDTLRPAYNLSVAHDGRQGIDMALELIPDIIITDVMMPEKDGFALCHSLKNDMRTSHIPIIMLTAKADAASRIHGLKTGADAYLAKPFRPEELRVRLKKLIELRRKLQLKYNTIEGLPAKNEDYLSPDDRFMLQLHELLEANLSDEDFSIEDFSRSMGISRMQLHRKLTALTGLSASHYIRKFRLEKACTLLRTTRHSVSEIAHQVGFRYPSYFSKVFTEKFGKSPTEFR